MTNPMCRLAPAVVLAMGLLAGTSSGQDFRYALFRLPPLNPEDPQYAPLSINGLGQLCGQAKTLGGDLHAAIWEFNSVLDLGATGGDNSAAHAINDLGEAVGWTGRGPGIESKAFIWRAGQMIDLGTLGGESSWANGINNRSQIVGRAASEVSNVAFIWEDGAMRALPSLVEGRPHFARAINEHGQIVGEAWPESSQVAVMWDNGQVFELPDLGRSPTVALAINDNGQAVGQSMNNLLKTRAAAWVDGQVFDLHRSGLGQHSSARGINNSGQVVGWVGQQPTSTKAFLWSQSSGMQILDPMVPPRLRENWTLTFASDVNGAGQIAAQGVIQGRPLTLYAFLLNPVSPSMEMSAPSPGAAGVANTITVSNVTPGARVTFLYSRHGGGARIPGCDLQQNALQLDSPTVIGSAIADANGEASITRSVPIIARGRTILFQAVVQGECAISQLVVHEFE